MILQQISQKGEDKMSEIKKYLALDGRVSIICAETTDMRNHFLSHKKCRAHKKTYRRAGRKTHRAFRLRRGSSFSGRAGDHGGRHY